VTITGSAFKSDGTVTNVLFSTCYGKHVNVVSDTELTVTTPTCSTGAKVVGLITAGVPGQVPTFAAVVPTTFRFN
jgi:hypothetical protein